MKCCSILVVLQNNYTANFNILFLRILIFLKSIHRVPSLGSLILTIKNNFLLINHLVLFLEHYLYMSREQGTFCFTNLKLYLIKIKIIEKIGKMLKKRESHWKYSKINTRLEFFIYFSFS